ncbi:sodium:calcium antiporter [Mycobacterium sp. IS-1496]|uniref:calcium/sodium antiporter n=1 Tax=Mycobacterium sp. IS-1496 TaxID=1772284 RepID=UPI000741558C|nr:calcium/sodium antiporter [Mycobacterium sp. IS-1496]KUI26066.1 sodium:calcium antiporter [Mycobacterium sp. IS-1496]
MLTDAAWFLAGLTVLAVGSEVMVRGATGLASRLGISPIVIGLTVVSIGTSMPELAVGVIAVGEGSGALAVGNIAGTNVVNVLLILGLSALLVPLALQMRTIRSELPVMAGVALLFWLLAADGHLSRLDGIILVVCAVGYTVAVVWSARRESRQVALEFADEFGPGAVGTVTTGTRGAVMDVVMTVGGIALLVVGADWLVDGAVGVSRQLGVSDALIGLTVVAIGTSAPELMTTVVSTLRGDRDVAIGNLIGSSVYNILLILGLTCLVAADGIALPASLVRIDIPIMVTVALACVPIFLSGRRVSRGEGGAMVVAYVVYLGFLLSTQT